MFSSASFAACSAASEVEMQSSVSPHLSIIALHDHKVFVMDSDPQQQQQQQHSLFSQASWGRLEMKPERNKLWTQIQQ